MSSAVGGVVLTGGSSRRMGRDKAFVEVGGRPMVVRVVDALSAGGCDSVSCRGGDLEGLRALGLTAVPDRAAGAGPVAAIIDVVDATDWAATAMVVIAACDLAHLDGASVADMVDAAEDARDRVAVAVSGGSHHLLVAVPRGAAASIAVAGDRDGLDSSSVRGFLGGLASGIVPVPLGAAAVRNVNAPPDIDRADS